MAYGKILRYAGYLDMDIVIRDLQNDEAIPDLFIGFQYIT